MKKLLYVAMAAIVLMACNPDDPKIVGKDKKMLDKASSEFLGLLYQSKKNVEAALFENGFVVAEEPSALPARLRQQMSEQVRRMPQALQAESKVVYYTYNAPEGEEWETVQNYMSIKEEDNAEEFAAYINAIAKSKKVAVIACVNYLDGKARLIMALAFAGGEVKNVKYLFLNCANNIVASLVPYEDDEVSIIAQLSANDEEYRDEEYEEYEGLDEYETFKADYALLETPVATFNAADSITVKKTGITRLINILGEPGGQIMGDAAANKESFEEEYDVEIAPYVGGSVIAMCIVNE